MNHDDEMMFSISEPREENGSGPIEALELRINFGWCTHAACKISDFSLSQADRSAVLNK
jgi:hypothetical protein